LFLKTRVSFLNKQGCKPGYVVDNHLSSITVTSYLKRPT